MPFGFKGTKNRRFLSETPVWFEDCWERQECRGSLVSELGDGFGHAFGFFGFLLAEPGAA
jgi:hypothetical protein